jgi:hypothetical protein
MSAVEAGAGRRIDRFDAPIDTRCAMSFGHDSNEMIGNWLRFRPMLPPLALALIWCISAADRLGRARTFPTLQVMEDRATDC